MDVPVEAIYEGLFDDDAFAQLPALMAKIADARSAVINWRHRDGEYEVMGHHYFSQEIIDQTPDVLPFDPWFNWGLRNPNRFVRVDNFLPPGAFERSPAAKVFVDNGDDTTRCMGMMISSDYGHGSLGVHRGRTQAEFTPDEEARLGGAIRHFRQVMLIRGELAVSRRELALAQATQDALAVALVTVGPQGELHSCNAAGERVLRRADGLGVRRGVVCATTPGVAARLAAAIEQAAAQTGPSCASVVVERNPDRAPYLVTLAPVIPSTGRPAALLVFRDPDGADGSLPQRVRELFGLTPAEAAIAVELSRGRAPDEIARTRGVTIGTLRFQLKALAAKLGVARQSEIAALVAALPQLGG
jgi:DNA-binding CsgD family transcriptional regulator